MPLLLMVEIENNLVSIEFFVRIATKEKKLIV